MRHPLTIRVEHPCVEWHAPSGRTLPEELADQLETWITAGELAGSRAEAEQLIAAGRFAGLIVNEPRTDRFRAAANPYRSYLITEPALAAFLGSLLIDASVTQRMHAALGELVLAGHLERRTEVRKLPLAGTVAFYHLRRSIFGGAADEPVRRLPIGRCAPAPSSNLSLALV